MRILVASAVLLATAACAAPPPPQQQGANCPAARKELSAIARAKAKASDPPADTAMSPAPPVPTMPPPGAVAAPASVAAAADPPSFPLTLPLFRSAPRSGRLTLSNVSFGLADVEAFVTASGDCAFHPGVVPLDRELPLNATWIIPAAPGSDVCWRLLSPSTSAPMSPSPEWNRAFTASGRFIAARL